MVEELKLAIKVDDDAIEQSLLKQFSNAEKMANKVVLTFNNIDLDDKAIEAKFKEMQKMAGKNPIDLSIDKSSIEMLSAISKQLGNIFDIAKGKSIIDSSATAQIDKLQSKLDELTKKYDELSSKKIGGNVSGKDFSLVDNEEFKKLSQDVQNTKDEITALKENVKSLFQDMIGDEQVVDRMDQDFQQMSLTVDNLTDKIRALQEELSNVSTGNKSNISSGIEDVFQGDKIDQVTTSAKELDNTLEQVNIPTDSFDEVLSKLDLAKSELGEIVKITKQSVSDSEGKFHDSYTLKDKRGSTEIYGLSSNTEKGQLLRSNIVGYDAKAEAQESKRLIEENIRLNKAYYDSKKQEEVEYQRLRAKYLAEGKAQEKKYYADLQKSADNTKLEEQKRIYKELNDSLDRYATVSKRIASGNALGSDEEEAAKLQERIEELQNSPILSKEQLELSQSKLEKIETTLEDIQKITKETTLDSLQSEIDSFNKDYDNRNIKPIDENRSIKYQQALDKYLASIKELEVEKERLSKFDSISEEELSHYKKLKDVVQENVKALKQMSSAQKGSDALSRGKEIDTITKYLNKFTGISKQARRELNGLLDQLQSGDPSVNVKKIHERFLELTVAERNAGREARNLFDIFKDKKIYSFLGQAASMFSFYDIINVARQAGQAVIDLNTNITELAKVSEASASQIYDDFNSYADIAKEVGGTISDTISATADWSRNGYNIPDSKELAEVAMIYKNVGDGIDIDQANEYLISTLRGFSLEAKDAMDIIDSINEVANNEPISSAGIGEALQRSAAAFNVANTSLQESIALVTSTNSVLQSPEKVGSMWTTVSARIRGAKTELEDAGLETDGMVESTSKLQAMIKGMTGFDILEDDQKTFKSIYDIIIGIGEEFQNLSGVDQAALLEALAGGIILPENMETYLMNIFNCKVNLKLYATI